MKELYGLYEKYTGKEPESVTSLTGSGSNRSYFRMSDGKSTLMGVVGTDALENKAFITPVRMLEVEAQPAMMAALAP